MALFMVRTEPLTNPPRNARSFNQKGLEEEDGVKGKLREERMPSSDQ